MLPHLDCLLHLPLAIFTQTDSKAETVTDLLLPSTRQVVQCLQRNHEIHPQRFIDPYKTKFCLARLSVDVTKFLGVRSGKGFRAAVSAGVCLPETCSSRDLSSLAAALCAIPSCSILKDPALIDLCGNAQVVLCGPVNRLTFEHNVTIDCVRDAPSDIFRDIATRTIAEIRGSSIEAKLREYAHPFHSPHETDSLLRNKDLGHDKTLDLKDRNDNFNASENKKKGKEDLGDALPVESLVYRRRLDEAEDGETALSFEEMRAMLDCGTGAFRSLRGQMLSGHQAQQFGHFDDCGKDGDDEAEGEHYCFVRYMGLLGQGRCVPRSCHSTALSDLLKITCEFNDPIGSSRFAGRSCLDFLNVIPLDLCLSAQLFGCGRPGVMAETSKTPEGLVNATLANAIVSNEFLQLKTFAQSALSPLVSPSVVSAFELAPNDQLSSTQKVGATLRTLEAFCNYDSHSLASEVGLTLPLVLCTAFFVLLPSLATLTRSSPKREIKWTGDEPTPPETWKQSAMRQCSDLLRCFDAKENYKSFLRGGSNLRQGEFPHMAGMRVLSMVWIILGHTFTSAFFGTMVANLKGSFRLAKMFDFQIVMSGVFAVDSFFFFSGFLLAYYGSVRLERALDEKLLQVEPHEKARELSIYVSLFLRTLLHRFLRLAGIYYFILALWIFLVPHIASGPMAPILVSFVLDGTGGGCRKNWWTNLLFINNLVPYDGLPDCMGWSWYLANDFQFFVLCLILLLMRHKTKRGFRLSVALIFVTSYTSSVAMILQNDVLVSRVGLSFSNKATEGDFLEPVINDQHFYFRPWFRVPPYLIGLLLGLVSKETDFKSRLARLLRAKPPTEIEIEKALIEGTEMASPQQDGHPTLVLPPHALSDAILGGIASQDEEPSLEEESLNSEIGSGSVSRDDRLVADSRIVELIHLAVFGVMLFLVYIPFVANNKTDSELNKGEFPLSDSLWWPRWVDVLYGVFSKSVWALCVGWFIIALAYAPSSTRQGLELRDGITKFARNVLSLRIFCVTSGLVFAAYLIHPGVEQVYYAADRAAVRLARTSGYASSLGWIAISFGLALPCVVMIEIALVKLTTMFGF